MGRAPEVFADARAIAWLQRPSSGGDLAVGDDAALVAAPAAGGPPQTVHARSRHDVVADDAFLYWVDDPARLPAVLNSGLDEAGAPAAALADAPQMAARGAARRRAGAL